MGIEIIFGSRPGLPDHSHKSGGNRESNSLGVSFNKAGGDAPITEFGTFFAHQFLQIGDMRLMAASTEPLSFFSANQAG